MRLLQRCRASADESRLFVATALSGDRVYVIEMDGALNENLFLAVLASMHLDPASATS